MINYLQNSLIKLDKVIAEEYGWDTEDLRMNVQKQWLKEDTEKWMMP